jgi:hypothetical protein
MACCKEACSRYKTRGCLCCFNYEKKQIKQPESQFEKRIIEKYDKDGNLIERHTTIIPICSYEYYKLKER